MFGYFLHPGCNCKLYSKHIMFVCCCILGVHNILTLKRRNLIIIYRSPNEIDYTLGEKEDLNGKFAEQITDKYDDS